MLNDIRWFIWIGTIDSSQAGPQINDLLDLVYDMHGTVLGGDRAGGHATNRTEAGNKPGRVGHLGQFRPKNIN